MCNFLTKPLPINHLNAIGENKQHKQTKNSLNLIKKRKT